VTSLPRPVAHRAGLLPRRRTFTVRRRGRVRVGLSSSAACPWRWRNSALHRWRYRRSRERTTADPKATGLAPTVSRKIL
jgi:hypothetical protein